MIIEPTGYSSSYFIERVISDSEIEIVSENKKISPYVYTDSINLKPHATYDYRLYSVNQLGEPNKTEGKFETFTRTLKNNPPNPVVLRNPSAGEYTTANPKFVFYLEDGISMLDPDGDEVRYTLTIQDDDTDDFIDITDSPFGTEDIGVDWAIDFPTDENLPVTLVHDKEYTWKIVSKDTVFGEPNLSKLTSSEIETFTVDAEFPIISNIVFGDENPIYHSSDVLQFSVNDLGSEVNDGSIEVLYTYDSELPENLSVQILGDGNYSVVLPNGKFQLLINAEDNAGNRSYNDENAVVWIDTEIPQITGTLKVDDQANGEVITARNSVNASFSANDSVSGLLNLKYNFVTDDNSPGINGILELSDNMSDDGLFEITIPFDGAVNRKEYSLQLEVVDKAGNTSAILENPSLTVMQNLTPPEVKISLDSGFNSAAGSFYVSDLSGLVADIDMDIQKYGIVSSEYGIKNYDSGEITGWNDSLSSLLNNTNLEDGIRYSIAVKVVNFLGLSNTGYSDIFIFDNSSATALTVQGISNEPYVSGETVRLIVSAVDSESTIVEYRLKIGTAGNQTLLTSNVNGQRDGVLVKDTGDGLIYSFAIPETTEFLTDGAYNVIIEVVNGSGLVSTLGGGIITLDNSIDKVIVSDSELFTSDTGKITGRWRYNGDKTVATFKYALLKASENRNPLVSEWIYTTEETGTYDFTDSSTLEQGETYKFFVQADYTDGTFSSISSNLGVTIDTTSVVFNREISTPDFSESNGLWINWDINDLESGISSVEAIVERLVYDGNGDIVRTVDEFPQPVYERLTEVDLPVKNIIDRVYLNSDRNGEPLDLNTGDHVYLTLRVTNGSGLVVDRVSEVIIIDDTAPPAPLVIDLGDSVRPAETVRSQWLWSEDDSESGITGYQWQVYNGAAGINPDGWSAISDSLELPESGTFASYGLNNDVIYVAVRAINGAGLKSVGISNGITLDDQAPEMALVTLIGTTGSDDVRYINHKNDLTLKIKASDNQSGIIDEYNWSYGSFDEYARWIEIQENQISTSGEIDLTLKDDIFDGDVIVFSATSTDDAGNSSNGYSNGVMYDSSKPEVFNINGYLSGDNLIFDWDSRHLKAPVIKYHYTLKKLLVETNALSIVDSGETVEKRLVIDVTAPSFEDNFYVLEVVAETAAANWSGNVNSNIVMVDKSAPVITDFYNNRFTSTKVDFNVTAIEPTSRITEFQYAVGTFEDPNTITGKWRSRKTGANRIEDRFEFKDLPGGDNSVLDGTELLVRVRVKNSAGLWSPVISGIPILVDKTPAVIENLEVSRSVTINDIVHELTKAYTSSSSVIEQILVTTTDNQSGITAYQFGVVPAENKNDNSILYWGPVISVNSADDKILATYNDEKLTLGSLNLSDKELYSIAMRAYNGSGDASLISFSNDVTTDLIAPQINFSIETSTSVPGNMFNELLDDETVRLISNGENLNVAYTLNEETSEKVFVEFDLQLPSMALEDPDSLLEIEPSAFSSYYTFEKTDIDGYGEYVIIARLTDAAGNYVDNGASQKIRLNSPPLITLTSNVTTPGQPLTFRLEEAAEDEDGLSTCYWNFGNGVESAEHIVSTNYTHKELWDSETDYNLNIRVSDMYGKSNEKLVNMKVLNTSEGSLYIDEYWKGDHTIIGTVEVPENITLNIFDDSNIYAYSTPDLIGTVGLLINGTLLSGDGVSFTIHDDVSDFLWNGIFVNGTAEIGASDISRAIRGLTATSLSTIGLYETSFSSNNIGLHAIGTTLILDSLSFTGNFEYAIKEDANAIPYVTNCWFENNTYDYYDEVLTAIDFNLLNDLSSNDNNRGIK